jgi:hypothetical protein
LCKQALKKVVSKNRHVFSCLFRSLVVSPQPHYYQHHSRPLANHLALGFSGSDGFASKMILLR